jgi:hypothetical protein
MIMNGLKTRNRKFSILIIGVGLGGGVLLFILFLLLIQPSRETAYFPTADILVLPGPSATPIVTLEVVPTVTVTQTQVFLTPGSSGVIQIGGYVQITGTGGEGLRLRTGPGKSNPPRFLGMDAEVFKVIEGPQEADGITWWHLEAPYDQNRNGWAAADYLTIVANPP